jgi:hypothetical protein
MPSYAPPVRQWCRARNSLSRWRPGVTASELTSGTGAEIGALSALGEPLHFAKRGIFAARERGVDSFTQR